MAVGSILIEVPEDRKNAIRTSAYLCDVRLVIRQMVDEDGKITGKYMLKRIA